MEEKENYLEHFDIIKEKDESRKTSNLNDLKEKKTKKKCHFPTAYTILACIEIIVFILTYIIPKGKFDTLEYYSKTNTFLIKSPGKPDEYVIATQEYLDERKIKIPLSNFVKGYIKKPISIPDTYRRITGEKTNFFSLFTYPVKGLIESVNNSFNLIILGGNLNILTEMNALSAGMSALSRITKGKEFLLIILVFFIISLCGTTFGMAEEIYAFYPILMPVFLKSGLDGILSMSPLFLGSITGNMFSTVNAFTVVLGSYSAGINFIDGIVFRIINLFLGDIIVIIYLYLYYKKIKLDEKKSICYEIKKDIENKFLKEDNKHKEKNEEKGQEIIDYINNYNLNDEKLSIVSKISENDIINNNDNNNKNKFTWIQKISLLIFASGFALMIIGVLFLDWWFEHFTSIYFAISIILMLLLQKGEKKAIEIYTKGMANYGGVALIIGIARGINITLDEGKISDSILNSLTNIVEGLPKPIFAILMLFIFIFLGFFINSMIALAVLALPILAPLADEVDCSRTVVINAYIFGQNLIGLIAPTGLILVILQIVGIQLNYWLRFVWPLMIIMGIYLSISIVINSLL